VNIYARQKNGIKSALCMLHLLLSSNETIIMQVMSNVLGCLMGYRHFADPVQFGPKTFRHHQAGAKLSRNFGTSAEVSRRQFGVPSSALLLKYLDFHEAVE